MAQCHTEIVMLKGILRFKSAVLPGTFISLSLLSFAFLLFFTLYLSQDENLLTQLDSRVYSLLKFTLYQAFLSTVLSLVVGVLLAWSLSHQSYFRGRLLLVALFSSSLVLPTYLYKIDRFVGPTLKY